MNKIILMCGIPGSGKSTYAKENMCPAFDEYVSRDEVRFSIVREDEEYFSHEGEVFNVFIKRIVKQLKSGATVWVDATHLTKSSRLKLLRAIPVKLDCIDLIWMNTPCEVALERNENRKGTRAYVPPSVIKRMFYQMEPPEFQEDKFHYNTIIEVSPEEKVVRKEVEA